jgi:L-ribulose-5-phosphate 4-epimerase
MDTLIKQAKQDFIEAARRAYDSGTQTGNGGNISVRIPGHNLMVAKASGVSFCESTPDNIVVTDFAGEVVQGTLKPTREKILHGALYKQFPHMGAIVHTHSPYAIAWSFIGAELPLITKQAQLKLKYALPVLSIETPDVRVEDIPLVYELFAKQPALVGFILQGHGLVSIAQNALEAEHNAEFIEETAKVAWLHAVGKKIGLIP